MMNSISASSIDITSLSQSGHNDLSFLASKLVAEPLITKVKDRVDEPGNKLEPVESSLNSHPGQDRN
jgi:hypothetical protein